MAPKVWFITGCSVGLGKKLAEEVLRRGDKVIATARNLSAMEDLAAAGATTIQLDITASQEELNGKVQEAIQAAGHIDVLVHNAASFQMGTWEDLTFVWFPLISFINGVSRLRLFAGRSFCKRNSPPTSSVRTT